MLTAFILTRYSTDNQNPDTTAVQVKKCAEYCRQHQLTVLDIFSDEAVSGMKQHRPEYDRMMNLYRAGAGADTVVIYDQSRMFRDMVEWFTFRRELQALGARVISVTQPLVAAICWTHPSSSTRGQWPSSTRCMSWSPARGRGEDAIHGRPGPRLRRHSAPGL